MGRRPCSKFRVLETERRAPVHTLPSAHPRQGPADLSALDRRRRAPLGALRSSGRDASGRRMQPTFQRRALVPLRIAASFGIAPAGDEPCASLHPVRFAVRRSRAPSIVRPGAPVVPRHALASVLQPSAGSALTPLSRSTCGRFRARARAAARERPRPRPPRLREGAVACSTRGAFRRRGALLGARPRSHDLAAVVRCLASVRSSRSPASS
jgi:hypothetical protein